MRFLITVLLLLLAFIAGGMLRASAASPTPALTVDGLLHVRTEQGAIAVGDFLPLPPDQRGLEVRRYLNNPTIQFEGITSNIFGGATTVGQPIWRMFGLSSEMNLAGNNTKDWTRRPFSFAGANSRFVVRDGATGFIWGAVAHDTSAEFQAAGVVIEEFAHYFVRPAQPSPTVINNYFGLYVQNLSRGWNNRAVFLEGRGPGNGIQFGSGAGPLLYASGPDVLIVSAGNGKGFVFDAVGECIKTLGGKTVWCGG